MPAMASVWLSSGRSALAAGVRRFFQFLARFFFHHFRAAIVELVPIHGVAAVVRADAIRARKVREQDAQALQAQIEGERPRIPREELLARRRARETDDAPTGQ